MLRQAAGNIFSKEHEEVKHRWQGVNKQADMRSCEGSMEKNLKIQKWEEGKKCVNKYLK